MNSSEIVLKLLPWNAEVNRDADRFASIFITTQKCDLCSLPAVASVANSWSLSRNVVCNTCVSIYRAAKREYLVYNPREVSGPYHVMVSRIALLRAKFARKFDITFDLHDHCYWCLQFTPWHERCREECLWLLADKTQTLAKTMLVGETIYADIANRIKYFLAQLALSQGADQLLTGCKMPQICPLKVTRLCATVPLCAEPHQQAVHVSIMQWVALKNLYIESQQTSYKVIRFLTSTQHHRASTWAKVKYHDGRLRVKLHCDSFTVNTHDYFASNIDIQRAGFISANQHMCLVCRKNDLYQNQCILCNRARTLWQAGLEDEALSLVGRSKPTMLISACDP